MQTLISDKSRNVFFLSKLGKNFFTTLCRPLISDKPRKKKYNLVQTPDK